MHHFGRLCHEMLPHLEQEEKVIFPYIRQIAHAYYRKDAYARLLVKTLRKPIEGLMHMEHEMVESSLRKLRQLANGYIAPPGSCISHNVILLKLHELDNDIVQHVYLENDILFPRALAIEKELLSAGSE